MNHHDENFLRIFYTVSLYRCIAVSLYLAIPLVASAAQFSDPQTIVVSTPGPHNISYLPIDLIPVIGADKIENVRLRIIHTGGGSVAMKNMTQRNADFAVAGVPAAMSLRAHGSDVVVIAPVDDAPLFVLMVRADLKDSIKRIADLKGKVIGVNTSTQSSKTTSQQLAELLLKSNGVAINSVRIVPAGQSWVEQSSLMISGLADAVVGDEPFASRLLAENKVFFLAHLAQSETIKDIPGANFLHAALETRSDIIANEPEKVEKMVRMVKRSLAWIASHTSEQVIDALGILEGEERDALLLSLQKYPKAFSHDGKFSTAQLKETDIFFHANLEKGEDGQSLSIEQMLDDRWTGRIK